MRYKITVSNYKSGIIKAMLFETVPVAEDDRIKVNVSNINVEPLHKDWQDKKGVWVWEFEIAPGAEKEVLYTLAITHPRNMQVEGL